MQTLRVPATPGRRAALEVVLLPASYSAPEDFVKAGFVEAVRARGLNLDLSFVPLELSDVTDRTIVATVLEELIAPAREHGTTVWLGGISLGGYLALCCAERAPAAIAGLALFAPYLGSYLIIGEIARAGLKSWTCAAGNEADEERRIWRFLKHREAQPPLHLGLGREDRFAERHRVLAAALEPGEVHTVPGGHDWPTWRRLWDNFLDVRLVRPA
jgi:pimeloyl-ACP methyl ester carboxylesterase